MMKMTIKNVKLPSGIIRVIKKEQETAIERLELKLGSAAYTEEQKASYRVSLKNRNIALKALQEAE